MPDVSPINLKHKLGSDIVSVKRKTDDVVPAPEGEIHFVITGDAKIFPRECFFRHVVIFLKTGLEVGDTKLIFTNVNGDKEVSSALIELQVFSALKVYPRNATVLIGSTLQFNYEGGPRQNTNVEFVTEDGNKAGKKRFVWLLYEEKTQYHKIIMWGQFRVHIEPPMGYSS